MTGMKNKQEYEEELRMGKGGFTLPGESGYEELTLKMAEKWGADVIRDSDGTVLSDEITHAGYGIYHLYYQRSQCLGKGESGQTTADLPVHTAPGSRE